MTNLLRQPSFEADHSTRSTQHRKAGRHEASKQAADDDRWLMAAMTGRIGPRHAALQIARRPLGLERYLTQARSQWHESPRSDTGRQGWETGSSRAITLTSNDYTLGQRPRIQSIIVPKRSV